MADWYVILHATLPTQFTTLGSGLLKGSQENHIIKRVRQKQTNHISTIQELFFSIWSSQVFTKSSLSSHSSFKLLTPHEHMQPAIQAGKWTFLYFEWSRATRVVNYCIVV